MKKLILTIILFLFLPGVYTAISGGEGRWGCCFAQLGYTNYSNLLSNGNYISYIITLTGSSDTASRHYTTSIPDLSKIFPNGYRFNIVLLSGDSVKFSHSISYAAGTVTFLKNGTVTSWVSPIYENSNVNPDYYIKLWGTGSAMVEIRIDGN